MEEKIKKLTKQVKVLSKLMLAIAELLSFATLVELTLKSMIDIWFKL